MVVLGWGQGTGGKAVHGGPLAAGNVLWLDLGPGDVGVDIRKIRGATQTCPHVPREPGIVVGGLGRPIPRRPGAGDPTSLTWPGFVPGSLHPRPVPAPRTSCSLSRKLLEDGRGSLC